jgi:hypothetical protein
MKQEQEDQSIKLNNIPIMIGSTHLMPGMKTIMTIQNRQGMDMMHMILRGNRRFVLMKSYTEMRGFVLILKTVLPTSLRNQMMAEVEGLERFVADRVYIPDERRGLYMNESEALRFADGKIIKDVERKDFDNLLLKRLYDNEIVDKLKRTQQLFQQNYTDRTKPEMLE